MKRFAALALALGLLAPFTMVGCGEEAAKESAKEGAKAAEVGAKAAEAGAKAAEVGAEAAAKEVGKELPK